jgi:hypothetical protein
VVRPLGTGPSPASADADPLSRECTEYLADTRNGMKAIEDRLRNERKRNEVEKTERIDKEKIKT